MRIPKPSHRLPRKTNIIKKNSIYFFFFREEMGAEGEGRGDNSLNQ